MSKLPECSNHFSSHTTHIIVQSLDLSLRPPHHFKTSESYNPSLKLGTVGTTVSFIRNRHLFQNGLPVVTMTILPCHSLLEEYEMELNF